MPQLNPKQRAADAALAEVRDGMVVGLGTGSTANYFIRALAAALRDGKLRNIRGVPTSTDSERLAAESGIPVVGFAMIERIDITIDGADEIGPNLSLIKGLGGALLREKMVAQNSARLAIIADESKLVTKLGLKGPVPVEIVSFGIEGTERFLRSLGAEPTLRVREGKPYVTDNGNLIFDCAFNGIGDPIALQTALADRAGIVESGLFLGLARVAYIARSNGVERITAD